MATAGSTAETSAGGSTVVAVLAAEATAEAAAKLRLGRARRTQPMASANLRTRRLF